MSGPINSKVCIMQAQIPINPDPRKASKGVSPGFQRTEITLEQPHERDMLRLSFFGTTSTVVFEPVQRASIHNFRPNSVTCCLQYAAVTRSSGTGPVLIKYSPYQVHAVTMSPQGSGNSYQPEYIIGSVTPNTGNTYFPAPSSAGAQLSMDNVLGQQQTITLTDLQGNTLNDVTQFYVSLVYFERVK